MRRVVMTMAALVFAGFAALAGARQEDTEAYQSQSDESIVSEPRGSETFDPNRDIVTDESRKPSMSMGESRRDSPLNTDYGPEETTGSNGDAALATSRGQSGAKAADLEGKTVVSLSGEEIGLIGQVGKSAAHEERVATIDVGGFLGVGERTIAVPLSKLHRSESDGDQVRISMMRTAIESQPEFDESALTPEE